MQNGLFVRKLGMTQVFNNQGVVIPVTLLKAEPCQLKKIKTCNKEGYRAIQIVYQKSRIKNKLKKLEHLLIGFLEVNSDRLNTSTLKELVKLFKQSLGMKKNESFGEFGIHNSVDFEGKKVIGIEAFMKGEKIRVTGRTTGKGFSGNQKRHNFHRGPMTHGSKNHRLPGSIGAGTTPGRVFPGKKMAGHLGCYRFTQTNVEILYVQPEEKTIVVKGSIFGKKNNLLKISAM